MQNTFSTIVNFNDYCNIIKTTPNDLGYFFYEQGLKSWSINSKNQLVLKGKTNENKIMSNIVTYCSTKVCNKCKSIDTFNFNDRGVKKYVVKIVTGKNQ